MQSIYLEVPLGGLVIMHSTADAKELGFNPKC